jgi:hypothetical protein
MLAVLWIIVALSVLAMATGNVARRIVAAAQREHDRTVGRWMAEGCISRFRAVLDDSLADEKRSAAVWLSVDTLILGNGAAWTAGCDLSARTAGRIVLDRAGEQVLDSLPGMSLEATAHVLAMRDAGTPIDGVLAIETGLSPAARALLDSHNTELNRLLTVQPDAWIVRSQTHLGDPPTPFSIEARFVRAGKRAAVVRWVEW